MHISIIFSEIIGANLTEILIWWSSTLFVTFLSIGNSKWLLDQLCFLIGWNFLAKIIFVIEFLHGGRYIPSTVCGFCFLDFIFCRSDQKFKMDTAWEQSFNIKSCGNRNKNINYKHDFAWITNWATTCLGKKTLEIERKKG